MATTSTPPPSGDNIAASAIFKKFLASAESYIKQPTRLKKLLLDAFNKAREKKEIGTLAHEAWDTLQSLFRLIKLSAAGEYTGVPTTTVVAAVAVLIYFLSPIDLIPDFIPVVGLLDDMALVAWFSTSIKHELDKFHEWEATKAATVVSDDELRQDRGAHASSYASQALAQPQASPVKASSASPGQHWPHSEGSAKHAGTTELPSAPIGSDQSATDAGLGSPSSSTARPVHEAGADVQPGDQSARDTVGNTTDSSRDGNDGRQATGGNVR